MTYLSKWPDGRTIKSRARPARKMLPSWSRRARSPVAYQPSCQHLGGALGVPPVAAHDVRPAHQELAVGAQLHLDVAERLADAADRRRAVRRRRRRRSASTRSPRSPGSTRTPIVSQRRCVSGGQRRAAGREQPEVAPKPLERRARTGAAGRGTAPSTAAS